MGKHIVERAAQAFADAAAQPPFLYELGPDGARQVLADIQAAPVDKLSVQEKWITVPAAVGDVRVRVVRPVGAEEELPAILYVEDKHDEITASPLRATVADLAGLPDAFLITDEHDVLRDEGEAYGRKLTEAGVRVTSARYNGTIHDFMMLNPLRRTAASTAAIEQAIHVLRKALG